MNNIDWIHQNYDRLLILRALDGTAFREITRTAAMIKQIDPMIDPNKLTANLSGLRKRGLIQKIKLPTPKKVRLRSTNTFINAHVNGWKLTPQGAGLYHQLNGKAQPNGKKASVAGPLYAPGETSFGTI